MVTPSQTLPARTEDRIYRDNQETKVLCTRLVALAYGLHTDRFAMLTRNPG